MPALLPVLLMICVTLAVSSCSARRSGAEVETSDQAIVPTELVTALLPEKFGGLPEELLVDRDTLVRQLVVLIETPPSELADTTRLIRQRAIIALGRYGGVKAIPILRRLAEDATEEYRRDAVLGLGRTKTKEGISIAAKFLKHENERLREAAIDALGVSDQVDALQMLKEFDASKEKDYIKRTKQGAIEELTARLRDQQK